MYILFLEYFGIRNVQDSKEEPNKFVRAVRHILLHMGGKKEDSKSGVCL